MFPKEQKKREVVQCCREANSLRSVYLLIDVVERDEEATVGGRGDLAAEEVLDELGALGFGVDGLGTFLEIDSEKSHCSVLGGWWG